MAFESKKSQAVAVFAMAGLTLTTILPGIVGLCSVSDKFNDGKDDPILDDMIEILADNPATKYIETAGAVCFGAAIVIGAVPGAAKKLGL